MNGIKNTLSPLIGIGTDGVTDEELKSKITLVNTLSLVLSFLVLTVGTIFYLLSGQLSILIPAVAEFILTLVPLYFNAHRKYLTAAIIAFLVQSAASVYFGVLLSNVIDLQAMVIFLISLIYLLFKESNLRKLALIFSICILLFLETIYHYQLIAPLPLQQDIAFVFRLLAVAGVLILIIMVSRPYVHSNDVNEQLKRSNNFKKVFVYQVTHELRTPLNAIYGVAQLLKREIKLDRNLKNIEPLVDQLMHATNNTRNIVNNVLDMAQIESGVTETYASEAFEVKPFFEKLLEVNKVLAKTRNIKLEMAIGNMPGIIMTDPLKLNQIVTNLLANAIKYGNKNSTALLSVSASGLFWTIQVTSQGAHIPGPKLKNIFDPFTADKSKYTEGTGLGLYIVKNKVSSMNGHIVVSSTPVGITTFTITLPLLEGKAEDLHTEGFEETYIKDLSDIHVLVAEDNEMSAMLISRMLKQIGCTITLTGNGLEVLGESRRQLPDLIIMDYHMDIMDGRETLMHLKNDPALKNIPVIIATGDAFRESRELLMDAGASAFIEKPIEYNSLIKLMHKHLHTISGELQE
ncbi:MAG TPA: hybrid sensor histidine kinase/response regulator [Chitinophaga sp.]|uniref:ATP-binding response regulator n=1 Tax=Chitinophaga sp. TaxID=1869181 RepID=UPI002C3A0650|nr:hybrid sensor histidine kinase/response regulator [Chitinophaga sp.]HVI47211.1 hybrid sensor histidine kinase/response regulator [Chitinophaga sp.]